MAASALALAVTAAGCGHAGPPRAAHASPACREPQPAHLADLCAMDEPLLSTPGPESYRFIWLRSFRDPVAVRVTRAGAGASLLSVEVEAHSDKILRRHEFPVDPAAWGRFLAHVEAADFWNLPTRPVDEERGEDGADWILEGRRAGTYHVVIRWSPRSGPLREACEELIGLSGLSFPPSQVY